MKPEDRYHRFVRWPPQRPRRRFNVEEMNARSIDAMLNGGACGACQ
jgi:hypothetical protein